MSLTRRDALLLGGAAAITAAGCGRVATEVRRRKQSEPWREPSDPKTTRLLDRMSFGWSGDEEATYASLGHDAYVEKQLKAGFDEPIELTLQLQNLDYLRMQAVELMEIPRGRVIQQLQCAAILRAVYSPNQLREKMVDFWSNHFNIYSQKKDGAFFKGNQEEQIIRQNALGNFGDMAREMAHSPAMLLYLDNEQNVKEHPNENYARELLELHTLGIYGGYTQKDVQEVARCLTGWKMETRFLGGLFKGEFRPKAKGSFRFDDSVHDKGTKLVLGNVIPAGRGIDDGEQVLDIAIAHPSTAKHLARKLVVFFTGARSEGLEAKVADAYNSTKGDIPSMIRPILLSDELGAGEPILKRPFDFLCASLRRSGAITDGGPALQQYLRKLGQPMYEWPMPDGYPVDQISWANTVLPRWQFAYDLAFGKIANTTIKAESLPMIASIVGKGSGLTKERMRLLANHLSAPEFQYA
ncbi:MAG: DUF1800 domain-containing protein [Armatimonadetes bacterium]|nr:DUF1800 domain-containing protein [Armatimonadota bacterium]